MYKVVPFVASIDNKQGAGVAATQLEDLITHMASSGFEYVRLERMETWVAGNPGCAGIGATPSYSKTFSVAVFKR